MNNYTENKLSWTGWVVSLGGIFFIAVMLIIPIFVIFSEALGDGFKSYFYALTDKETFSALSLTFIAALVSIPLNLIFGISAAWVISKYNFFGRSLLISIIELPFAVPPVITGLMLVLIFGGSGFLGNLLNAHNVKVIFALPGIILATIFVTFPFVARQLIPLMESQGIEEEEAGAVLGANGFQIFFMITLPNIKWGLIYGVLLSTARAVGEFGAVSVVSGHIMGVTNTLPLYIETLYDEFNFAAAFGVASMLTMFAAVTLVIKTLTESKLKNN